MVNPPDHRLRSLGKIATLAVRDELKDFLCDFRFGKALAIFFCGANAKGEISLRNFLNIFEVRRIAGLE
jgi:hypothetical protein